MNLKDYIEQSERTERKFPEGMEVDRCSGLAMNSLFKDMKFIGGRLDQVKKHLIYGKPLSDEMWIGNRTGKGYVEELAEEKAEALHALLGIITEVSELADALTPFIFDKKSLDVVNVEEELADAMWYIAILVRLHDIDFEAALNRNIEKLKARFPEKFDADRAINRDVVAERVILEGADA